MRKSFYICISIVLVFVLNITITEANNITEEVRVGLMDAYNVNTISFYNNFSMGYTEGHEWVSELTFDKKNHYILSPLTDYWLESTNSFSNCTSAKEICDLLKGIGYQAIPVRKDKMVWGIYIGPFKTEIDAERNLNSADKYNDEVSFELSDTNLSKYIIKDNDEILAVVDGAMGYPQYVSENELEVMKLGDRSYRGKIEIGIYENSGLSAINQLSIEEYLYGVLPSEVDHSWPIEALKAQAVASRTYVLYNIDKGEKFEEKPYDLTDTESSQVYKGYNEEQKQTTKAVLDTKGEVILHNGTLIEAFYFSSSGGYTEDSENVWSAKLSYIKSVPDTYELALNREPWRKKLTKVDIETILSEKNINIGKIMDLEITDYSTSGRAMSLKILGSEDVYELNKEEIRRFFGLKSRMFKLIKEGSNQNSVAVISDSETVKTIGLSNGIYIINGQADINRIDGEEITILGDTNTEKYSLTNSIENGYTFIGQGNGHGVGMSQCGTYAMALEGFDYVEILKYYYNNIEIKTLF